ncbi:hypothetical protein [Bradyrhizobium sp. USDA 10063]
MSDLVVIAFPSEAKAEDVQHLTDVGIDDRWMKATAAAIESGRQRSLRWCARSPLISCLRALKVRGGTPLETPLDHTKEAGTASGPGWRPSRHSFAAESLEHMTKGSANLGWAAHGNV